MIRLSNLPIFGSHFLGRMRIRRVSSLHRPTLSNSRGNSVNKAMLVKASFMEPFQAQNFSSRPAISSAGQPPPVQGQPSKVFVGHTFYKGKAALNMKPKAPEFSTLDSGGMKLSKEGGMYLTFAPAVGTRQYDWSKKQVFALSVAELGSLLSLSSNESCEFFHDPFMGKSDAGQIRKVLQVVPVPNSPGYFFSLMRGSLMRVLGGEARRRSKSHNKNKASTRRWRGHFEQAYECQ